jgi:enterochelin esterase-like enzyme
LNNRLLVKDYISQEIIPFVDTKYRTISSREGRAISGWSNGGLGAIFIGLSLPEKFSLAGVYSGGVTLAEGEKFLIEKDLIVAHKQGDVPLQFYVYVGRNDDYGFLPLARQLVQALEEANLPHVYVEDDGNHFNEVVERVLESIVYFSKFLGDSLTAVQPQGKLTTKWGEIKTNH